MLRFDTQNARLMQPCFGEIQHGKKDQINFLIVCKFMGAFVIDVPSLYLVIA